MCDFIIFEKKRKLLRVAHYKLNIFLFTGNKYYGVVYDKSFLLCKNLLLNYEEQLLEQEQEVSSAAIESSNKEKYEYIGSSMNDSMLLNDNQELVTTINNINYGDLNKASIEQLAEAKRNMNVTFEASCLKPGDDGYEYDKQEEFDLTELNETSWDSY